MKIQNNFLSYRAQQPRFRANFNQNTQVTQVSKKTNDASFYEAHKVLNDPLMMDSMAIILSDTITASKIYPDKPLKVEDFKDKVLKLFAYNIRAQQLEETQTRKPDFDVKTGQVTYRISYDDLFKKQSCKKEPTQLDLRVDKFTKYHKVNSNLVLPEVKKAFANMSEEYFDILPDGLISHMLKAVSSEFEDGKIFLNENLDIDDKVDYLKQLLENSLKQLKNSTRVSKNPVNNPKMLRDNIEKIILAKNIIHNLAKIEDEFDISELEKLFAKSEKGRYLKPTSLGVFEKWLASTPYQVDYYRGLDSIRDMI